MNKTQARRYRASKRAKGLAVVRDGIAAGTLRIRQLTPEERLLNAPRPRAAPKPPRDHTYELPPH